MTQASSIATGEAATCRIVRVGDTLHASNAGSGTLSEVRDAPGEALALLGTVATDSGTVDATASSDGTLTRVGSVTVPGAWMRAASGWRSSARLNGLDPVKVLGDIDPDRDSLLHASSSQTSERHSRRCPATRPIAVANQR